MPPKLNISEDERKARLRAQKRDYMRRVRVENPDQIKVWDENSKELRLESARKWKLENPERAKGHIENLLKKDPDYYKRKASEKYWENPVLARNKSREWQINNPDKLRDYRERTKDEALHRCRVRQATLKNRMPSWANKNKIKEIYIECKKISESTGVPHEVDHIYPLMGREVSGLHHEDNLRIITREENRKKGSKMPCLCK